MQQLNQYSPGKLTAMCAPVSVCQYVSTTEHFPPPTFSLYQRHASGLIGSPEERERERESVRLRVRESVCVRERERE